MPSIRVGWNDRNWIEQGHHIYRSLTPMDVSNMPAPIATVGKNVTFYDDYDVIEGTEYYYRIGAYINNDVAVSNEFSLVADSSTLEINDIFFDNSIIAYYPLDGNGSDRLGLNTGIETSAVYDVGVYDTALSDGYIMSELVIPLTFTVSFYAQVTSTMSSGLRSLIEFHDINNNKHIIGITSSSYIGNVIGADTSETNNGAIQYKLNANLNEWYHITYDSNGDVYVNGILSPTIGNEPFYGGSMSKPFAIAYRSRSVYPNNTFNGTVDQIRVFNRILTQNEIDRLGSEY